MPVKFVGQSEFRRIASAGRARGVGVVRQAGAVDPSADQGRVRRWRFSDGSVDRLNDRINPNGWDTDAFMRAGGPVLFAHDAEGLPIGGTRSLSSNGMALVGEIEFATADDYPFADTCLRLVDAGFLRAGSVGFLPRKWSWADDPSRPGGINFEQVELLEFSLTATPALPTALIEARSFGIDTRPLGRWAERALRRGHATVNRADLERLRAAASSDVTDLASHRVARDLVRSAQIRAHLARMAPLPVHTEPPEVMEARRHELAEQQERREHGLAYAQATRLEW